MKTIMIIHNSYNMSGGEDVVFNAEADLISGRFRVIKYSTSNKQLSRNALLSLVQSIFNLREGIILHRKIKEERPDVIHVHNTFPYLSSSIYIVAKINKVPVISTLHNYRLTCVKGTHYREGKICVECGRNNKFSAIRHRCYQDKLLPSIGAVVISLFNELIKVDKYIDKYVALTDFSKRYLIKNGIRANKVLIKPNFTYDPNLDVTKCRHNEIVYIGRLSEEKGIRNLINFWENNQIDIKLKIYGSGPLEAIVKSADSEYIEYKGYLRHNEVPSILSQAKFLIFPSEWYEGMPMIILESLSCGTPVICRDIGGLQEIIDDGTSGLVFRDLNTDLISKIKDLINSKEDMAEMSYAARKKFEDLYSPQVNLIQIENSYNQISEKAK